MKLPARAQAARRRARRARRNDCAVQDASARSQSARSTRLHHSVRSAGLSDGDEIHQRPDQDRHHHPSSDCRVHGCRQDVSCGVLRREVRAALQAARARHVRTAGSSGRHPVPGWPSDAPVRQRGLDPRVSDGGEVRSNSRWVRWTLREGDRPPGAGAGQGSCNRAHGRPEPCRQQRIHRDQSAAGSRTQTSSGCRRATTRSSLQARQPAELQKLATDLGVNFEAAPANLSLAGALKLRKPRIAVADQYGGSIPSGWTRYVLEQFEFPFEVVYPKALDAGNLSSRFDVHHPSLRRRTRAARDRPRRRWRPGRRCRRCNRRGHSGGVSADARFLHRRAVGTAAQTISRGWRDDPRCWAIGSESCPALRLAD